ncbi:DUF4435 domain-containing protein [Lelliottia amnigena]|uniref:DUF4435 domain-containing protein n=1 Tax=Lelliottia amnigena TaxID=61646 RepID=UPI00157567D1|nr:DUF4435 domain-containing protein [Lelliottia amnigena]NTX70318.1 DUF4435 domain-containing protein [Lelliottia amnigena]
MSQVKYLTESMDDTEVFFLEYSRVRGSQQLIFIIEGKDDPKFYTSKIANFFYDKWDFLSVGGKSKVLELRRAIKGNPIYCRDKTFFMIDKDFDEEIIEKDIYTTPSYSIENIYCEPGTVRRMLVGECGLSNYKILHRSEILEYLTERYLELQSLFHKNKRLIIANIIFLYVRKEFIDKKVSLDRILKININIVEGDVLIKLNWKSEFNRLKKIERAKFIHFVKNNVQVKEVLASPGARFRGKQEIGFLKEFVKLLKDNSFITKEIEDHFSYNLKLDNPSLHDHMLSSLAQYVRTPDCLINFFETIKSDIRTLSKV